MRKLLCLAVILFAANQAFAQEPNTGYPPYGSFEPGRFDAVNRQNLNVSFAIPVVGSPGRGTSFGHALVYDALVWKRVGNAWTPVTDENGNPTWGWKLDRVLGTITYKSTPVGCEVWHEGEWGGGWWEWEWTILNYDFAYIDRRGTRHQFSIDYHEEPTSCGYHTGPRKGEANSGSGYLLDAESSMKVIKPDGTQVYAWGELVDRNGNKISRVYVSSSETHWKDTLGRISLKIVKSGSSIQYKFLKQDGYDETTTLSLGSFSIKTNFGCGVTEYTGSASLPTSMLLPNGRSYTFEYEDTPGWSGYKTGRVKKVTLPTGGSYEYQYPNPNNGINCGDGTINQLTRLISDGASPATWQYARTNQGGTTWKTVVTAPQLPYDGAGNQSVFIFTDGRETEQKHYQGAEAGTPLSRVVTAWAANGSPSSQTVILANNQQSKVETTFDWSGRLLERKEYDWGSGTPGAQIRQFNLTYLSNQAYLDRNILNLVTQQLVKDGGGTIKSRTDISYDSTSLTCVTGSAQHDDGGYGCSFTARGNPTAVTTYTNAAGPSGAITRYFYFDSVGNLRKADVDCCQQKQWNYSATTQYAYPDSEVSGPPGGAQLTTSYFYNFHTGLVTSTTDPNSKTTSFWYDTLRRPTTVQRPDGASIAYAYDDNDRTYAVEVPTQGSERVRHRSHHDPLGRPWRRCTLDANWVVVTCTDTSYDSLSRGYRVSNPHTSSPAYWTETRFDALGRPTIVLPPDGSTGQTTYSYSGNTVTITDATGKWRQQYFDAAGRLVRVTEPGGNDTYYSHTVMDGLAGVTQGVQTRTYNYDSMGRLLSAATPEAGTVSYVYNSFNLVTQRTDARGVVTTYGYDTLNRPTSISYNDGTPSVGFAYGSDPNQNNNGRLVTMTDGVGSESYSYDVLGRVTQAGKWISGGYYQLNYAYNLASELTSVTYPSGRVVTHNYDAAARLASIASGGTNYASGFGYNAAQQVTAFSYGNNVAATFGYWADRLQLASVNYTKSGGPTLVNLIYCYRQNCDGPSGGNNGQIVRITDLVDVGRTVNFTYDDLYRLGTAVTSGSGSYPQWGLSWSYDRYGNRLAQTVTAGSAPSNSLSISPYTNRVDGYSYDAAGNQLTDGLNTLAYDAENRVKTANGGAATYQYDGNGLRVRKVAGGTTTVYIFSGTKVIAEYVNGGLSREYIYAGTQLIATEEGGTRKYHHADHLSARVTTDTSGNIVSQQGHYPFGEAWYDSGSLPQKFTSYNRDSETLNDYAVFRSYINRFGRFSSPDPLGGTIADPQSLNRYAYALNIPVSLTDPLGLSPEDTEWPVIPYEADNALNTWGSMNCVSCQFNSEMMQSVLAANARFEMEHRVQQIVNQANLKGLGVFLWTAIGNGYAITAANQQARLTVTFGSLTIIYDPQAPRMERRLEIYVLDVMIASGVRSMYISATTNGRHAPTSWHPDGQAVDISRINGRRVLESFGDSRFMAQIELVQITANNPSLGVAHENYGPAGLYRRGVAQDPGAYNRLLLQHQNHVHLTVPAPVRRNP
jgi:RHS repeat-associated protein